MFTGHYKKKTGFFVMKLQNYARKTWMAKEILISINTKQILFIMIEQNPSNTNVIIRYKKY